MANTIKGTKQPQMQGRPAVDGIVEIDVQQGVGATTVFAWEGPVEEVFGILTPAFYNLYTRVNYRQNPDNVTATIRATTGGIGQPPDPDEVLVDDWELVASGDQPDIRHHAKWQGLSVGEKNLIEQIIEEHTADDPSLTVDASAMLALLRNGKDHFIRSYSILRRTQTVTNPTTVNIGMSNIERRHLFGQLPAITNSGVSLAVQNLANAGPPFAVNSAVDEWSWLKQRPTLSGAAGGFAQIQEEWWLYVWPIALYDSAV